MAKLIASIGIVILILLVIIGSAALTIAVLVNGYGLTVVSWHWVIGGAIGHLLMYAFIQVLGAVLKALD